MTHPSGALARRLIELAEKATPGPWSIESCGEKGDGANMIGRAFGPDNPDADGPMSGWLPPFDNEGNEIEYYREELVAVCDHANRSCGPDAAFIAAANPQAVTELARYALALEAEAAESKRLHTESFQLAVKWESQWREMNQSAEYEYARANIAEESLAAARRALEEETVTDAMIDAGVQAIDDYYNGTKDVPFRGGVAAVYCAMRAALSPATKEADNRG